MSNSPEVLVSTRATDTFINSLLKNGLPMTELGKMVQVLGAIGIHIHPTRFRLTDQSLEYVYSIQQSFRSERNLLEIVRHYSPALAAASYAIYPERMQSLETINAIQSQRPETYAIVYPLHERSQRNGQNWNRHWAEQYPHPTLTTLQNQLLEPFPELLDRWGIESGKDLIRAAQYRNYSGFAISMKHILRDPGSGFQSKFDSPHRLLQILYPYTKIFFITQLEKPTNPQARLVYDFEQGILESLRQIGWDGLLVIEPDGFGSLRDPQKLSDSIESIKAKVA